MTTETATRAEQIVYITEWASRYGATLQFNGEVGFGRPCVGILKGDHYIDTADVKNVEAYQPGGDWWQPEDAYHKHDCLAVLSYGDNDAALAHYQAGFAPLLYGIIVALALTCFLKETGPAARKTAVNP